MKTRVAAAFVLASLSACGVATDPATRLAADIEEGADRLRAQDGATESIHHATPSRPGQCEGPYKVQLDKVGAMIVWCKDAAGETLVIDLERRAGRTVIANAR